MSRNLFFRLGLVLVLLSFATPALTSDQTFPIGLWLSDVIGSRYGFEQKWLASLRWQGINVGTAGGGLDSCKAKLARYDSSAYRIWLAANPFHISNNPQQNLDIAGRWINFPDTSHEYFISVSRNIQDPSLFFSAARFNSHIDTVVSTVVDSVKNAHALWKYFYWDEPNNAHYYWYTETWKKYWENIWWGADTGHCNRTDSLGVHSWLKWKIEHRDLVHEVCINLGNVGGNRNNAVNSLCNANYRDLQGNISANKMKCIAYDDWPFGSSTPIGDTVVLKSNWTDYADSMVAAAKRTNPADPIPVYVTQLQDCGGKKSTCNTRIQTPEEVREMANLAVLHEDKGIFYFVLPSDPPNTLGLNFNTKANFWDEKFVPFDAPYEEYVYQREDTTYYSPDSLKPFSPDSAIHDPFRTLGIKPNPNSGPKGWENYYLWKYAPFARNWNFLKTINEPLHIIAPHLRNIWKVGQRITSVAPDTAGGQFTKNPEYVTFADSVQNHPPTAFYAFIVSKDFNSTQRGFTVTVNGSQLPQPPIGQRYYVLDLNSRHLIPSTGNIVFHTVLKPGEGRLFRFIIGPVPPGGGGAGAPLAPPVPNPYNGSMWSTLLVTDPDISFRKSGETAPRVQFTEGDTVVLSATVYNLGFANKTDSVKFYLGDPLAGGTFLGGSSVTVPALSGNDTLSKSVTVSYNLVTNSSTPLGPKDFNVFLKGASSSAHSLLWLNAEDYATKVNNSPWDMAETKPNQDIASYTSFVNLTDSISGVWEGSTYTMPPPPPTLHFRLASPIDASKYKVMQFRIFSDKAESVTVRWYPLNGTSPGMYYLPPSQWQVVTINLVNSSGWSGSVTDYFLQFLSTEGTNNCKIRLPWAKLTTR